MRTTEMTAGRGRLTRAPVLVLDAASAAAVDNLFPLMTSTQKHNMSVGRSYIFRHLTTIKPWNNIRPTHSGREIGKRHSSEAQHHRSYRFF